MVCMQVTTSFYSELARGDGVANGDVPVMMAL